MHISYPLYKEHLLSLKSGSSDTHKTKIGLGRITATLLDKCQNGWKARNMWTRLARTPFQKLSSYSFLSNVTTFGNVFFALGFLGRGKMKKKKKRNNSQLCLLSLRDTEIPLATLISALSAVDNILSEPTTIHHVILDGASVMFREDHHGVSRQPWLRRVLCLGPLRPSPPGGTAGRWMWLSPPAGCWVSVRTSW